VAFNRPGVASSLTPKAGRPNECSTSVLPTTTRVGVLIFSKTGFSYEATFSNWSTSNRWSTLNSDSLCQFHWFPTTLMLLKGKVEKKSCKHNKWILGKAIVINTTIGRTVHPCSNNSESGRMNPTGPVKVWNLIKITNLIITINQTITISCNLSNRLETSLNKFWNPILFQNATYSNIKSIIQINEFVLLNTKPNDSGFSTLV